MKEEKIILVCTEHNIPLTLKTTINLSHLSFGSVPTMTRILARLLGISFRAIYQKVTIEKHVNNTRARRKNFVISSFFKRCIIPSKEKKVCVVIGVSIDRRRFSIVIISLAQ